MEIIVDGELFEVTKSGPVYKFEWMSGINEGYGFSQHLSEDFSLDESQIRESIHQFLLNIDPETGYIVS